MALDPVTISSAAPIGPAKGIGAPQIPDAGFATALANAPASAAAPTAQATAATQPPREISRAALPGGRGSSIGDQVLERIESVHKGDVRVRAGGSAQVAQAQPVSVVLPPGPASQALAPGGAGQAAGTDGFDAQLRNLREMYDQAVQVSLMTKSTGSLNGTINKLMSAQ